MAGRFLELGRSVLAWRPRRPGGVAPARLLLALLAGASACPCGPAAAADAVDPDRMTAEEMVVFLVFGILRDAQIGDEENDRTWWHQTGRSPATYRVRSTWVQAYPRTVVIRQVEPCLYTAVQIFDEAATGYVEPYGSFTEVLDFRALVVEPIYRGAMIRVSGTGYCNQLDFLAPDYACGRDAANSTPVDFSEPDHAAVRARFAERICPDAGPR